MADCWTRDVAMGLGANVLMLLLCWLRDTPANLGLQLSLSSRRYQERRGMSVARLYASFPGHFRSGLCCEDFSTAGGVVLAVALTAAVATEIAATAGSISPIKSA